MSDAITKTLWATFSTREAAELKGRLPDSSRLICVSPIVFATAHARSCVSHRTA